MGRERKHVLSITDPDVLKNEMDGLQTDFDNMQKEYDDLIENYPKVKIRRIQWLASHMNLISKRLKFRSKRLSVLLKGDTKFKSLETKIECGTEDLSSQVSLGQ